MKDKYRKDEDGSYKMIAVRWSTYKYILDKQDWLQIVGEARMEERKVMHYGKWVTEKHYTLDIKPKEKEGADVKMKNFFLILGGILEECIEEELMNENSDGRGSIR